MYLCIQTFFPEKSKSDLKTAVTKEEQDDISHVHPKKPKLERDIKPEFDSNFKIKIEPIEEFNRGMGIITNMNVPTNVKIKNENIDVPKIEKEVQPKIETDVKPKFDSDIKIKRNLIKIEPIEEFNQGMGIITNMNVPASVEIKNENIDVPKIEVEVQPKTEADFQAKSKPIDDINMNNIPHKAENQNENYHCSFCKLVEFTGKHLLIKHMVWNHRGEFQKKHQCSKCCEVFGKIGVFEKINHFVMEHAEQYQHETHE